MSELVKIDELILNGLLDQALDMIYQAKASLEGNPEEFISYLILKTRVILDEGDLQDSIDLAENAYNLASSNNFPILQLDALVLLSRSLQLLGKQEECLVKIQQAENEILKISDSNDKKLRRAHLDRVKGSYYMNEGQLSDARILYKSCLKIFKLIGNQHQIARSCNSLGTVYLSEGKLDMALDFFHKTLKIYDTLGTFLGVFRVNNNIGLIYLQKGEYDLALEYFLNGLSEVVKYGNKQDIAAIYTNLGYIYHQKGDYIVADNYYQKCLIIDIEFGNDHYTAETLYNLISLNVDSPNIHDATTYLNQLQNLVKDSKNKIDIQRSKIAKARVLKTGDRMIEFAQAQELFREVVNEEVSQIELTIDAKLGLCELLIHELKLFGTKVILQEITDLINSVKEAAQDNFIFLLLIQVFILQHKIAIINGELSTAAQLLNQAELMSVEKDLKLMIEKINDIRTEFENDLDKWNELSDKGASMYERIQHAKLDEYIKQVQSFVK